MQLPFNILQPPLSGLEALDDAVADLGEATRLDSDLFFGMGLLFHLCSFYSVDIHVVLRFDRRAVEQFVQLL